MLSAFSGICNAIFISFELTPSHLPYLIDKSVRLSLKYKNLRLEPNFDESKTTKVSCKLN